MPDKTKDFDFIVRNIESVDSLIQLDSIGTMIDLFKTKWDDQIRTIELRALLCYKSKKMNKGDII
jgi:hypothetical protein